MTSTKNIPQGITIIYFDNPHKNIYAKMPLDKEIAQRLAKCLFMDAMLAVAEDKRNCELLCQTLAE